MRKQINEARGVLANITNYAKKIFDAFLSNLKMGKFDSSKLGQITTKVKIAEKFLADNSTVDINEINIILNFKYYALNDLNQIVKNNPKIKVFNNDLVLTGLGMGFDTMDNLTQDYNFNIDKSSKPNLYINFLASNDVFSYEEEQVYKLLTKNYSKILSIFAHEIKHHIDMEAKGQDDLAARAKYSVTGKSIEVTDNTTLNDFVFNLYYMSLIENIVRPTEFKTKLEADRVTKKEFLKNYYDSEMYKVFNVCENITFEKLYDELKAELEKNTPKDTLDQVNLDENTLSAMTTTIVNIIHKGAEYLMEVMIDKTPIVHRMYAFEKKFKVFMKKHMLIKFNSKVTINFPIDLNNSINIEKTYRAIIKDMNFTANKMKKKIAKIYEDIPYEYVS
jgi:hypothetical protein